MTKSVYVLRTGSPGDWEPVVKMFLEAGWAVTDGFTSAPGGPLVDLVCFTGGSDVDPSMYGEMNTSSYSDVERDDLERDVYLTAVNNYPMVGICRGGQLLNVMNGGKMIQHIDGHSGHRDIVVFDREGNENIYMIHEDHHQGILKAGHGFLGGIDYQDQNQEIVWYEDTRSLCFQPHPEWGHEPTKKLFFNLIEEYIFEEGH